MRTILCLTDFSESSINANNYACQLAQLTKSKILLLHSYYVLHSTASSLISYNDVVARVSNEMMEEEVQRIRTKFPKLSKEQLEYKLSGIDLETEVLALEEKSSFNLIVMGSKGRSEWEEIFIGSSTATIVESSATPVLAVPRNSSFKKAKSLLFAAELDEQVSEEDLQLIDTFIERSTLVHVFHNYQDFTDVDEAKEEELMTRMRANFMNQVDLAVEFKSSNTDSIQEYSHKVNADMLVLRKRHHDFLASLFTVSISKGLSFRNEVPLLVLK